MSAKLQDVTSSYSHSHVSVKTHIAKPLLEHCHLFALRSAHPHVMSKFYIASALASHCDLVSYIHVFSFCIASVIVLYCDLSSCTSSVCSDSAIFKHWQIKILESAKDTMAPTLPHPTHAAEGVGTCAGKWPSKQPQGAQL